MHTATKPSVGASAGADAPCSPSTVRTPAEFIEERKYLSNVTQATLKQYYGCAFKAFEGCADNEAALKRRIMELLKRGVKPVSINSWITCINTYLHWVNESTPKCSPACRHTKLGKLKTERCVLATFSPAQQRAILGLATRGTNLQRVQVIAALLLDTGLRISELLSLRRTDVDLDAMRLKVMGKGRKERIVPISIDGRRWLYGWLRLSKLPSPTGYIFATHSGTALSIRNCQRDLVTLCDDAGVEGVRCSPHTFRHTFAVTYLRVGGNLEMLRRILGHTNILITQRYLASLSHEDVAKVHNEFSPLAHLHA